MRVKFFWLLPSLLTLLGCRSGPLYRYHAEKFSNGKAKREGPLSRMTGTQEGEWTYYYENGAPRARGMFVNDAPAGKWTFWHRNGAKEMEGAFESELRTGWWQYWHPNGRLRATGSFHEGVGAGEWTFWSSAGELDRRGDFDGGKKALKWTYWRPGGKNRAEGYFLNGAMAGRWKFWDREGKPSEKTFPLPSGWRLAREISDEGRVLREGFLKDGVPAGRWSSFGVDGGRRASGSFADGSPEGWWIVWRDSGQLLGAGKVIEGEPAGTWTLFTDEGEHAWQPAFHGGGREHENHGSGEDPHEVDKEVEDRILEMASTLSNPRTVVPGEDGEESAAGAEPPAAEVSEVGEKTETPPLVQLWTVREESELADYLETYSRRQIRRRRPSDPYAVRVTTSRGDAERAAGMLGKPFPRTTLLSVEGRPFLPAELRGRKALLVFLRGSAGRVCVQCLAQTRALANRVDEFGKLKTEVFLVYPGPRDGANAFLEAYARTYQGFKPPYRVLLDPELELSRALGLASAERMEGRLIMPASIVVDRSGIVRYAFVGMDVSDRPTAEELLNAVRGDD